MIAFLKKIFKTFLFFPSEMIINIFFLYEKLALLIISNYKPSFIGMFRQSIIDRIDSDQKDILHQRLDQKIQLKIYTPNTICSFRHTTFSSKEPEILEWIDEYGSDGNFYDIGANIGIYSLYYAATKSGIVYSFEPSVFNLRQLAKNININNFSDKINIITNPLLSVLSLSVVILSSFRT